MITYLGFHIMYEITEYDVCSLKWGYKYSDMRRDAILVHFVCFFYDNVGIRNGYKRRCARRMCEK